MATIEQMRSGPVRALCSESRNIVYGLLISVFPEDQKLGTAQIQTTILGLSNRLPYVAQIKPCKLRGQLKANYSRRRTALSSFELFSMRKPNLPQLATYRVSLPFASTRGAGCSQPVGRWTHTFTRCPVSVAARSEAKLSPNNRATRASQQQKRGISDRKTIRRVNIYLVGRPEAGPINQ